MVFVQVLVPVFLIVAIGWLFARLLKVDVRPLSKLTLYVLTPCLIFIYLLENTITGQDVRDIIVFTLIFSGALWAITIALSKLFKFTQKTESALLLSTVFTNNGNYGLPVLLFAFGQAGFERGIVLVMFHFFLMYSFGVYWASRANLHWKGALVNTLKMPAIYAALLAVLFRVLGIGIPEQIFRPIKMVGDAGIAMVLLVLGMQLSNVKLEKAFRELLLGSVIRLVIAPAIALVLVFLLGIQGLTRNVLVIEAAMPSAVITTLLAIEYDTRPELVSSITLITTVASFVTLAVILNWFVV